MISNTLFLSLCSVAIFGEILSPECNYVSVDQHFYPIAACTTERNVTGSDTTYYAYRFICEGEDVIKYEYDTSEYCDGQPVKSTNISKQSDGYECSLDVCEYSTGCSYIGCYEENATDSCQECRENKPLYDRYCFPIITGDCNGNIGEILKLDQCQDGVLNENVYYGNNCSAASFLFAEVSGGSNESHNCYDEAYYEVDCVVRDLPDCNYAATGTHYYPIHSCDRTKTITDSSVDYFAFEYVCVDNDVYRNEYDTSDYCEGTPTKSEKVNHLLEHYDCDLGACRWADACSLSLSSCDENQCEYNMHCLPTVVDNCVGNVGELLHSATCDSNTLSEYFYVGDSCDGAASWSEVFSGDDSQCGEDTYYKVECVDAESIADDISTQCTPPLVTTTEEPAHETTDTASTESTSTTEKTPSGSETYRIWLLCFVTTALLVFH